MPLTISCPVCGLSGQVPDGSPSGEAQCPRCGASFMVPGAEGSPAPGGGPHRLDDYFANVNPGGAVATPSSLPPPPEGERGLKPAPGDGGAEAVWLKEERQRFDDYTAKQFGQLQRQREEMARWQTQVEEALVAREQESNRQAKVLAGRADAVQQGEAGLAKRTAELEVQGRELKALEASREEIRQEIASLRELLQQLKEEAVADDKAAREMRTECLRLDTARRKRQRSWEAELAEWNEKRKRMEEREAEVDRANAALQRRAREIEELELKIRAELETREEELSRGWRELEERAGSLG